MRYIFALLNILFIVDRPILAINETFSLNNSNCSLSFSIETIYKSNIIETNFPIQLLAHFNLACPYREATAYYKVTPLSIIIVGKYKHENESLKSMIELNTSRFQLSINESSTIRLCVSFSDNDGIDDDDEFDTDYRLCRQIHVGISTLYEFWTWQTKSFYIILTSITIMYYIYYFIREQRLQRATKIKTTISPSSPVVYHENHDTFENEKINEKQVSDDDEEDED